MNRNVTVCILGLGLAFCQTVAAVTVKECVDKAGHRTFEDHCSPATVEVAKKELKTGPAAAPAKPSIVLYVTEQCESCDAIRTLLEKRGVTFSTKDVSTDVAIQAELRDRIGDLVVPTLAAGDKNVTGYNRKQINEALAAAGYPEPTPAAPTSTP